MSWMATSMAAVSIHLPGQEAFNVWPLVGILAVFAVAFIVSRFVRGDPYYDRNAGRDRRDSGGAPVPFDDDGGGDGNGNGGWS